MATEAVAILIFIAMFALILSDRFPRHLVTLFCGLLTIVLVFGVSMHSPEAIWRTLNLRPILTKAFWITHEAGESSGINWSTIIFICGMMIMVEGMARVGFFRWLCMRVAKMVHYKKTALFIAFTVMSALLAMFIDSITVILFLVAVTIELAGLLEFNPVPMILSEIFCANLGGSATMCGDPPNIIIGTSLGYSFFDFLVNTGAAAGIGLMAVIVWFYFTNRKTLKEPLNVDISKMPDPKSAILDKRGFISSTVIFAIAVVLLVTHASTGLTVAFIGVFISILTLLAAPSHIKEILSKVDFRTLLFFVGLFVVVAGLEETGVLTSIANLIGVICQGNPVLIVTVILWLSGIASAFVDNIPFAATMLPVIQALSASQGMALPTLAWSLSLGCDVGGSATPIGASANVVGISTAEKAGHSITWGRYCKENVPATIIVLLIANLFILAVHVL